MSQQRAPHPKTPKAEPQVKKTIGVASSNMFHAPGMWRYFRNAMRTEPQQWSEEAIKAFTNNRVTDDDLNQILAGRYHTTEEPGSTSNLPTLIIHIHEDDGIRDVGIPETPTAPNTDGSIAISTTFTQEMVRNIIHGFMDNFPEASLSLQCEQFDYDSLTYTFWDDDEGQRHVITEKELIQAFKLLFTDQWPLGFATPPATACEKVWDARFWNHADASYSDAFAQLAIFGKVIYG